MRVKSFFGCTAWRANPDVDADDVAIHKKQEAAAKLHATSHKVALKEA